MFLAQQNKKLSFFQPIFLALTLFFSLIKKIKTKFKLQI